MLNAVQHVNQGEISSRKIAKKMGEADYRGDAGYTATIADYERCHRGLCMMVALAEASSPASLCIVIMHSFFGGLGQS